jgi:hypothetical protein
MFLFFFQYKSRLRKRVSNDNHIDLASSACDYKSNKMMTMIKKKHILLMIAKWSKNESNIYIQPKKKLIFSLCFTLLACALLLKRISIIVVREWREKKRKRRTTCRHRSPARRSMITLDWLSSAFRRVLRSSSLIFTRYLLSIVSYVLSLYFSFWTLIVLRRWIIYTLIIIWQWLCAWFQYKREHTHISWKKRSKESM